MKIRKGFVSNSSSCSFLVLVDEEPNTDLNMKKICKEYGSVPERDLELSKNLKKLSNNFDKLPKNLLPTIKKVMEEATLNKDIYFWADDEKYDDSEVWTPEMIAEELQKEYEAGKGKTIEMELDEDFDEPQYYPNDFIDEETWLKFPKWKEDLKDKRGYFHRALRNNIKRELEWVEFSKNIQSDYLPLPRPFETYMYNKGDEYKVNVDKIIDDITEQTINDILEEFGDCEGYFVKYVTDGGSSNPFRYIAEMQTPFQNFPYHIKFNNH